MTAGCHHAWDRSIRVVLCQQYCNRRGCTHLGHHWPQERGPPGNSNVLVGAENVDACVRQHHTRLCRVLNRELCLPALYAPSTVTVSTIQARLPPPPHPHMAWHACTAQLYQYLEAFTPRGGPSRQLWWTHCLL